MHVLIPKPISLKGLIKIEYIKSNGVYRKLYDGKNTIQSGIAENFKDMLDTSAIDIAMNNLFANDDVVAGSTEDAADGIAVYDGGDYRSTVTTSVTPANTYGKKYRGEIEFSGTHTISEVKLGHDFGVLVGEAFAVPFAQYTAIAQAVAASDRMVFNWEIYL